MENTFDFRQVPEWWALCFLAECPRIGECLRYQVGQVAPEKMTKGCCVMPSVLKQAKCPHFHPIVTVRAAVGFTHIFDEVKERHHADMRAKIAEYLGGGGTYYRYRNGTKLLMPEQQQWIRNLFKRYGYQEDIEFDNYRTVYRFD
jgi:hypothetical protein